MLALLFEDKLLLQYRQETQNSYANGNSENEFWNKYFFISTGLNNNCKNTIYLPNTMHPNKQQFKKIKFKCLLLFKKRVRSKKNEVSISLKKAENGMSLHISVDRQTKKGKQQGNS